MFTGIVEELGRIVRSGRRLEVRSWKVADDSGPGASVAVNGVCLTVVERTGNPEGGAVLSFDLSSETKARTALHRLGPGDPVNLERPVTLLSRLGGHLVQGHVDGVGLVEDVDEVPSGKVMRVKLPGDLARYVAEKGSIAVDGVSLTVTETEEDRFEIALVPYTLDATTLGTASPGDPVNVEVDIVAKYIEGLVRSAGERP
jgi:riboflavin synthase